MLLLVRLLLAIVAHDRYTSDVLVLLFVTVVGWRLYDHEIGEDATPHHFLPAYQEAASEPKDLGSQERAATVLAISDEQFAQHVLFEGSVPGCAALLLIGIGFSVMIATSFGSIFG